MSRSVQVKVLSRRDVLGQLAALAALGACAKGGDPHPEDSDVDSSVPLPTSNPDVHIPPITPNEAHYITTCCGTQQVDASSWRLTIRDGDIELTTFTLAELEALPAREREHTLMCISANPRSQKISNAVWTGLPLVELLATRGVSVPDGAAALKVEAVEGFSTGLPIGDLEVPIWVVWRMNGDPLPPEHGFPARLLVPGRYGMKNPKWLAAITFVAEHWVGYWESRGWSDEAFYRPNALVRSPRSTDVLIEGPLRITGTAYAGSDPVTSVQVRIDDGDWVDATLDYAPGADRWVTWHLDWDATPGDHVIQARCATAGGAHSIDGDDAGTELTGYGGSMSVDVDVR